MVIFPPANTLKGTGIVTGITYDGHARYFYMEVHPLVSGNSKVYVNSCRRVFISSYVNKKRPFSIIFFYKIKPMKRNCVYICKTAAQTIRALVI